MKTPAVRPTLLKLTGGKGTIRPHVIEAGGSHEVRYGPLPGFYKGPLVSRSAGFLFFKAS